MSRTRNYKDEYRRRIAAGAAKGLSRSQARGHARADEVPTRAIPNQADRSLIKAARHLERGESLTAAARKAGISAERLRSYVKRNKLAERHGRSWRPVQRRMLTLTRGRAVVLSLGFEASSFNGKYLNAAKRFRDTNNTSHLAPFVGRSITDVNGREYLLETRPNALYRLAAAGSEGFEEVYRLIT